MGGYYPPVSFRVSEATRNLITTKPEFCHSEHRRCEESLLLYKHKLFLRCAGVTFGAKVTKTWVTESTAASGGWMETEEGKTTSRQEGLQPVAVCDDCFSGPFMVAIPPRPTNAAQVWNATSATNREKFQTSFTLFLRTVIFPRFTQAYRHL